jgi:hypothetical protein
VLLLDVVDHLVLLTICLTTCRGRAGIRTFAAVRTDMTLEVCVGTECTGVTSAVLVRAEVLLLGLSVRTNIDVRLGVRG